MRRVYFIKKCQHFDLYFWPSRPWAGLLGLRVVPYQKVAYHKSVFEFDFSGGNFYEKIPKLKIFVARPASPALRPHYFRPGAEIQNSAPNKLFVSSSRFQKGMTQPPCIKNLGEDRFGRKPIFQGLGLTQRASGSKSPTRKLLARSFGDFENFMPIHGLGQKLRTFFAGTDTRTHRQTDT